MLTTWHLADLRTVKVDDVYEGKFCNNPDLWGPR